MVYPEKLSWTNYGYEILRVPRSEMEQGTLIVSVWYRSHPDIRILIFSELLPIFSRPGYWYISTGRVTLKKVLVRVPTIQVIRGGWHMEKRAVWYVELLDMGRRRVAITAPRHVIRYELPCVNQLVIGTYALLFHIELVIITKNICSFLTLFNYRYLGFHV